ncbi:hypothetical protein Avbf_16715 [Armadillidium vulgare]|nr:hypothetical protein Avbf_16715 [Armadillidium vulgare]
MENIKFKLKKKENDGSTDKKDIYEAVRKYVSNYILYRTTGVRRGSAMSSMFLTNLPPHQRHSSYGRKYIPANSRSGSNSHL